MAKSLSYRIKKSIRRRIEFENFLIYNQDWRKGVENGSFEELYSAAADLEKALLKTRFTDSRTLQKMKDLNVSIANYVIFTPHELSEVNYIPMKLWEDITKDAFTGQSINPATVNFIINFFKDKGWKFLEDISNRQELIRKAQKAVHDKYTHVSAGSRIIDQGDRVTARHIAMLQAMKKALNEKRSLWHPLTLAGSAIMVFLLTYISAAYFRLNHPQIMNSNRKLFLLVTIIILTFGLAKVTELFLLSSKNNLIEVVRYPLIVPFAAILLCSLMNTGIAVFTSGFLTVVLTIALAFDRQGFMIINLLAAVVAILSTRSLRRRKEIFVVCAKAWLCCVL